MRNSNKPNTGNEPQQPNNPTPEDDLSDVWLEDRKARPGETFYGGRGVLLTSSPFSNSPSNKQQQDYKQRMMAAFEEKLAKEAEGQFSESPTKSEASRPPEKGPSSSSRTSG